MLLDNSQTPSRADLKDSVYESHEVTDDFDDLTKGQRFILDYFKNKTGRKRLIKRSDVNPRDLTRYLPNIALFDITFDGEGVLCDVSSRLLGTAISGFYGELTGESVNSDRVEQSSPQLRERLMDQVNNALKYRNAVATTASSSLIDKSHIQILTLTLPMSENNADIDKIFMLIEVNTDY